jgi:hypothetical protein
MLFIPTVVYATTYNQPDVTSNNTFVYGFQSVSESYDQLYLIGANVTYAVPANAPPTMSTAYISRVIDTATGATIAAARASGVFNTYNTIAGCNWFTAIYLTAAQITTLGYNPVTDFGGAGASVAWTFHVDGDGALTWGGTGIPPTYIAGAGIATFYPSTSVSTTGAQIATTVRLIGTQWNLYYPTATDLLQMSAGVLVFTTTGQQMFADAIPNLYVIAPQLFPQTMSVASFPNAPFIKDYYLTGQNATKPVHGINWVAETWTPTISYTLNGFEFMSYVVGNPGNITGSLYATDVFGFPTGAPLATGTLPDTEFATYTAGEYNEITFVTAIPVTATTVYAFVISAAAGGPADYINVLYNSAGTYVGALCLSGDSGATWASTPGDMVWNAISNSIVNDAYQQKQQNGGGGNMFAPLGAVFGVSGMWISVLLWCAILGVLCYYATRYTNDYRAALPILIIGMPIGYLIKFMPIYMVVTFEFLIVVAAIMFFARSQPE